MDVPRVSRSCTTTSTQAPFFEFACTTPVTRTYPPFTILFRICSINLAPYRRSIVFPTMSWSSHFWRVSGCRHTRLLPELRAFRTYADCRPPCDAGTTVANNNRFASFRFRTTRRIISNRYGSPA